MDNTQLDCFRFCRFLKLLGNIMILMVLALVGVSYFAVAYTYTGDIKHSSPGAAVGGVLILAVFTAVIVMLCWSYFATVLSNPGSVPPGWHPFASDEDADAERERITSGIAPMASVDPVTRPRFCRKCQAWKPQRAHHCSISNKCILKMDHYCIWVVNCVGLMNYKFFLLFLFYTLVASFLGASLLVGEFIKFFNLDRSGQALSEAGPMVAVVFIAFVIDIAFTVCLAAFVLMHWNMVSKNQTTIELYEKTPMSPWPYDKGSPENLREVFGREPFFWLLPMHTKRHRDSMLRSTLYPYLASGSPETPLTASYRTEQGLGGASERYLAQPTNGSLAAPSQTGSGDGLV